MAKQSRTEKSAPETKPEDSFVNLMMVAAEFEAITKVEKLARLHKSFATLLSNYVNFADFYGKNGAVFQTGTLYLDNRSCNLCVDVTEPGKHAGDDGSAAVMVAEVDGVLRFEISDDGAGFQMDGRVDGHGFVNMADRFGAFGGSVEVTSSPGSGTKITGTIPLPDAD